MTELIKHSFEREDTMATSSLIFKKVVLTKEAQDTLLQRIENERFRVEKGQGYHVTQNSDGYIFAYYIYSFVSSIDIFDELVNDFKKVQYEQQEFIPFCLDYENNLLVIFGNRSKINRVIDALGSSSNYLIIIDDIQINTQIILEILKVQNINYHVSKIKVKDVQFSDGIACDCTFKIANSSDASNIITKYHEKIVQYTVRLDCNDEYNITIYKSGAISIYKDFASITIEDVRIFYPSLVY